jgi:hypothetical protein
MRFDSRLLSARPANPTAFLFFRNALKELPECVLGHQEPNLIFDGPVDGIDGAFRIDGKISREVQLGTIRTYKN